MAHRGAERLPVDVFGAEVEVLFPVVAGRHAVNRIFRDEGVGVVRQAIGITVVCQQRIHGLEVAREEEVVVSDENDVFPRARLECSVPVLRYVEDDVAAHNAQAAIIGKALENRACLVDIVVVGDHEFHVGVRLIEHGRDAPLEERTGTPCGQENRESRRAGFVRLAQDRPMVAMPGLRVSREAART